MMEFLRPAMVAALLGLATSQAGPDCFSPNTQAACNAVQDQGVGACQWQTSTFPECQPSAGNPCPAITTETQCDNTNPCVWSETSCILSGPCTNNFDNASCTSTAGCAWTNVTSGTCSIFTVDCSSFSTTQATCNAATDRRNNRACMYQTISTSQCAAYSQCLTQLTQSGCQSTTGCSWVNDGCQLSNPPTGAGDQNCFDDGAGTQLTQATCSQGSRAGTSLTTSCLWYTDTQSSCVTFDACAQFTTSTTCSAQASQNCNWDGATNTCSTSLSTNDDISTTIGAGEPSCFEFTAASNCTQGNGCSWVVSTLSECQSACTSLSQTACNANSQCTYDTSFSTCNPSQSNTAQCFGLNSSACSALGQACTFSTSQTAVCNTFSLCYAAQNQGACTGTQGCMWSTGSAGSSCIPVPDTVATVPGSGGSGVTVAPGCFAERTQTNCEARMIVGSRECSWSSTTESFCTVVDDCNGRTQAACTTPCQWDSSLDDGPTQCFSSTIQNASSNSTCFSFDTQGPCSSSTQTPSCTWRTQTDAFCTDFSVCISSTTNTAAGCNALAGQCWWDASQNSCNEGTRPASTTTQTTTPLITTTPTTTPFGCAPSLFACPPIRQCLSMSAVCNGQADCPDGSDEGNCSTTTTTTTTGTPLPCEPWQYTCADRTCVADFAGNVACDGTRDCADGSDEAQCTTPAPTTVPVCVANSRCLASEYAVLATTSAAQVSSSISATCRACFTGMASAAAFCGSSPAVVPFDCTPGGSVPPTGVPTAPSVAPTIRPTSAPVPPDVCLSACGTQYEVSITRLNRPSATTPAACRACVQMCAPTPNAFNIVACPNNQIPTQTWCRFGGPGGGYPVPNADQCAQFQTVAPTGAPSTASPTTAPAPTAAAPPPAESSGSGGGGGGGGMIGIIIIVIVILLVIGAVVWYRHQQGKSADNAKAAKSRAPGQERGPANAAFNNPNYEPGVAAAPPAWADPSVPFLTRSEAAEQLAARGNLNGDFIVRQSAKLPNGYIVTSVNGGVIANSQLKLVNGNLCYGGLPVGKNLAEAVAAFQSRVQIAAASGAPYNLKGTDASPGYLDVNAIGGAAADEADA